jgi:N utilization substance protein B
MALPQKKAREIVVQWLYSYLVVPQDDKALVQLTMRELKASRSSLLPLCDRVHMIHEMEEVLDKRLESLSDNYSLERVHAMERCILHVAIYEMLFDDEIPPKVAITEGVRLTKKFSTPEGSSFVNAVLDQLYKDTQAESAIPCEPEPATSV